MALIFLRPMLAHSKIIFSFKKFSVLNTKSATQNPFYNPRKPFKLTSPIISPILQYSIHPISFQVPPKVAQNGRRKSQNTLGLNFAKHRVPYCLKSRRVFPARHRYLHPPRNVVDQRPPSPRHESHFQEAHSA